MAKTFDKLSSQHLSFINDQKIYFVGTAKDTGRINISPKGMDSFRILNENKVIWLNLTGSGNETSIHLQEEDRMTIMFCSFEKNPLILRLYGHAKSHHKGEAGYDQYIDAFPTLAGSRQIIEMDVDLVQTSCGFGVPFMDFVAERDTLKSLWEKRGDESLPPYWKDRNSKSIDGFESEVFNS